MRGIVFLIVAIAASAAEPLFEAVRRDDVTAIRRLTKSASIVDERDAGGLTPLMYAATYASPECMKLLLDKGADANASTKSGATPLFFAVQDLAKTRMLVERGADVKRADRAGLTPVRLALGYAKNAKVVAYLADHGADVTAKGPQGNYLRREALLQGDEDLAAIAAKAGLAREKPAEVSYFQLAARPGMAAELVKLSYDLNTQMRISTLRFPTLGAMAHEGFTDAARTFLNAGARVNEQGNTGLTPLMMAVTSHAPRAEMMQLLIESGADVNIRDRQGRTALDWARMQGENNVAKLLREAGAQPGAPLKPAPAPVSEPRSAAVAMARAVERLQPIGPAFFTKSKCISCHNQSLPAMAIRAAQAKGIAVNEKLAAHGTEATFEAWAPQTEALMQGRCMIGGFIANTSYGMLQLAAEGQAPSQVTDAVVQCMIHEQDADGSWNIPDTRPPLGNGPIKWTALAMHGIDRYAAPASRRMARAAVARGLQYLRKAEARNTQDVAFRMLGLKWQGAPKSEIEEAARSLRALQRADGGWGQTPEMASDAYATGQAMYAVYETAGEADQGLQMRKAAAFLLRTQMEDGSWFVRSRALAFQPYFDAGFPHGTDQFISAAATSWAVLGLSFGVRKN